MVYKSYQQPFAKRLANTRKKGVLEMLIAGVDEAGRGPALGPMVIAITVIEKETEDQLLEMGVKDSKLLTREQRNDFFPKIKAMVKEYGSVHIEAMELDELMERKSLNEIEAMKIGKLLNDLKIKPELVFVDSPDFVEGNFAERIQRYLNFKVQIRSEHKADINYPVVSAASVIAKVERDFVIDKLAEEYGFMGSGYSHDAHTIHFIEKWLNEKGSLPFFARKQWATNKNLVDKKFQTKLFE